MAFLNFLLLTIGIWVSVRFYKIYTNYTLALSIGLPIIFSPLDCFGRLFFIIHQPLSRLIIKLNGPETGTWWLRAIGTSWLWALDDSIHKKLGRSFIVVGPARNIICTDDPKAIDHVLAKRKDFHKPEEVYRNMNFFGKNVSTTNGADWSRHRKLTGPCFNERVSSFVWDEAIRQARSMLSYWLDDQSGMVSTMVEDVRLIALHVLTAAGFGISHNFLEGARMTTKGHGMSQKDAMKSVLDNLVRTVVLCQMPWLKKIRWMLPNNIQTAMAAIKEFEESMDDMVAAERHALEQGRGFTKANLISTMVRINHEAKLEGLNSNLRLSEKEMKGNVFIFTIAGHDTTASTLAYAHALLAMHPDIQDWVVEEVDAVLGSEETLVYEKMWPKLKRVLAVMYETLRLYGPIPNEPRTAIAPNSPLVVTDPSFSSQTRTIYLPANTSISLDVHAVHMNPTIFPNPKAFNPKRWIKSDLRPNSPSPNSLIDNEDFIPIPLGYAPWSNGPRVCLGMKFAQVEFVAVMVTVLRDVRILPCVKGGLDVSFEDAKTKMHTVLRDSALNGPLLKLTRPKDLWIKVGQRASRQPRHVMGDGV